VSWTSILVAADMAEASAVQRLLAGAGIGSTLELAESLGIGTLGAGPCRVLVDHADLKNALEVLEDELDEDDQDADDGDAFG
jgi:hypothetical protein